MRILVTGASGFIGSNLMRAIFVAREHTPELSLRVTGRTDPSDLFSSCNEKPEFVFSGNLEEDVNWSDAVNGCDVVVHVAGAPAPLSGTDASVRLLRINRDATISLAEQAAQAGVRRFVYVSSLKVCGNERKEVYQPDAPAKPQDEYGRSKHAAELGLHRISSEFGMELAILRPAMVFSRNGQGNFQKLVKLVASGVPLPFASVSNQRSMISIDDLNTVVLSSILKSELKDCVYMVAHRETISTPSMIKAIANGLGKQPHLWRCPPSILEASAGVVGLRPIMNRLTASYRVDSSRTFEEFAICESASLARQIEAAAKSFLA